MAFVSTLGASNATSFVSAARATSLLSDLPQSPGIASWLLLGVPQKEQTLVGATMTINPLKWKGKIVDPYQSLAWPRYIKIDGRMLPPDELPLDFEIAVSYMAAFLTTSGGYAGIAAGNDGGALLRENDQYEEVNLGSGSLQVKYKDRDSMQSGFEFIPPFVMDILSRYIIDSSFHQSQLTKSSVARIDRYYGSGAFRGRRVAFSGGKIYPAYGGWASNPL
jgi:hypothetical protein